MAEVIHASPAVIVGQNPRSMKKAESSRLFGLTLTSYLECKFLHRLSTQFFTGQNSTLGLKNQVICIVIYV